MPPNQQANSSSNKTGITKSTAHLFGTVKQTHSKTSSNTSQQSRTTNSIPIINAPTSLANLAQLSGITLLPVNNTIQPDFSQDKQQITSNYDLSSNFSRQNTSNFINSNDIQQHRKQAGNETASSPTKNFTNKHNYDLTGIPSIHLLNHQISTTEAIQSWRQNSSASLELEDHLQSISSPTKKKIRRGRQSNYDQNSSIQANEVQVIPLTEGHLPNFSGLPNVHSAQLGSNYDDILSQPSLDSIPFDQCSDFNGDMNNISLVKLMAILNNPALTITAVDSNKNPSTNHTHKSNDYQQTTSTINLFDKHHLSIPKPSNAGVGVNSNESYQLNSDCLQDQQAQLDSTRMQLGRVSQSAANIQVMQEGSTDHYNPPYKYNNQAGGKRNSNSIDFLNESSGLQLSKLKQSDLRTQNWLSNSGPNLITSNIGTGHTLSWTDDNDPDMLEDDLYMNDRLNDPTMLSTSVRNLMMQQLPSGSKNPTVSVQLMKHIANQTKDNNLSSLNQSQRSMLEPECILTIPRTVQQLSQDVKRTEKFKTVTSSNVQKKVSKEPLRTSKNRLYIPRVEDTNPKSRHESTFNLSTINIDGSEERQVHLSERHHMLDIMLSNQSNSSRKSAIPEPDEIFINRSKRIMSKIDTMVERKKRRRFERICGRSAPKTNSLEEQCIESENEWSGDEESTDLNSSCFIKIQLPLEEIETPEKKDHLLSVGLVSRDERNKLLIEQCEERMKIFSPLALEAPDEVPEDIRRFVDIMLKTGGGDIQLRTDSNIKRNELPLLEGLNRNTSRMKMSYMNILGLEKRSKRTTLYKVKPNENNLNIFNSPKPNDDLNNKSHQALGNYEKVKLEPETSRAFVTDGRAMVQQNNALLPTKQVASLTSCREALKPPSKNEYMKSLGLMAS